MSELPIISQIADILGYLLRFFYVGLYNIGINNVTIAILLVVTVVKLCSMRKTFRDKYATFIGPKLRPYVNTITNKYIGRNEDPLSNLKVNIDKQIFLCQYNIRASRGGLAIVIKLCILFALYGIVENPARFIPELNNLTEAELLQANTFFGCSISDVPHFQFGPMLVFPILVGLSNFAQTLVNAQLVSKVSGKFQGSAMNAVSIAMMFFFSANFPIILSIYWIFETVVDICITLAMKMYVQCQDIEKIKAKYFKKLNRSRKKRGLPDIDTFWDLPQSEDMRQPILFMGMPLPQT